MSNSDHLTDLDKNATGGDPLAPALEDQSHSGPRRDFLYLAAGAMGVAASASFVWPVIDSLSPAADTLALSTIEVDLAPVKEGQAITVKWRGKPVFIRHRTAAEIAAARDVPAAELATFRDPEEDAARVKKPEWLVMVGVCTHLGCVPLGQKETDVKGEYNGWFCPCHGSAYDTSGRIRKGPAPTNLAVPAYTFLTDTRIKIG